MSQLVTGRRAIADLGQHMRGVGLNGRAFVVSDERVFPLHGPAVLAAIKKSGYAADSIVLPAGETTKSLPMAERVYDWLVERRAERMDTIVALGGGVVGDLAGFVAATYLRGMPLVNVPTTLLGQIDSAIGGKVAVNHSRGKNLIGAFYPARLIVDDPAVLDTLPQREITAGWAEAVKCALILDGELLDILEENAEGLVNLSSRLVGDVIERCAQHKVRIVEQDEREAGLRMILNYGHTIGHALEAALNYDVLLHGEAVSIGMTGAAAIAARCGILSPTIVERQRRVLELFGLPVHFPTGGSRQPTVDSVVAAMSLDKKSQGAVVRWVLLEGVGRTRIEPNVPLATVREVVAELVA